MSRGRPFRGWTRAAGLRTLASYPHAKKCGAIMVFHIQISDTNLRRQIRKKEICLGGNERLKIYGTLNCRSGKRMKKENRVFFISEKEALDSGYRPCGHCMRGKYKLWKTQSQPLKECI
jgi:hypothetical protein